MQSLRSILQSSFFFLFLFFLVIVLGIIRLCIPQKSKYNGNETILIGKVIDSIQEENKLKITLKGKEKVIVYYNIKEEEQLSSLIGAKVKLMGTMAIPKGNTIPNTLNYKEYLEDQHIHYLFYANELIKIKNPTILYQWKNKIIHYIEKLPHGEFFSSFILGREEAYDTSNLRINGISHLFAVSGMHFAFFLSLLNFLFQKKKFGNIFISFFLLFYAFIVGFTPSVLRVILFYFLKIGNKHFKNIWTQKQEFLLILLTLLLYDPFYIKQIGFQFSFLISYFLISFSPMKKNWQSKIIQSVFLFLISLPICAIHFYEVNFLSILWNILFIPFASLLYPLCFLGIVFPFLIQISIFFINIFEYLNNFCAQLTFGIIAIPKVPVFLWGIYYSFFFYKKRKHLLLLLLTLIVIQMIPKWNSSSYVYFLDVGQGDAALIISPYQKNVTMIDTGGNPKDTEKRQVENIRTFLYSKGIQKINTLILSHGDYDHMGNAKDLIEKIKIDDVILNQGEYNDLEKELIKVLNQKKIPYEKGGNIIKNIQFLNTKIYDNENDNSNVIYYNDHQLEFLFMGDAGEEKEKDILQKYSIKEIEFLKVGHHGSNTSTSKEWIETIQPQYSIISVGKNNNYGHPTEEVLNRLSNSQIYRTDESGSIEIKRNRTGYQIKTYH